MANKIWTPEREQERQEKELLAITRDKNLLIAEMCQRLNVKPPDLLIAATLAMTDTDIPATIKALQDLSQRLTLMCLEVSDDPNKAN